MLTFDMHFIVVSHVSLVWRKLPYSTKHWLKGSLLESSFTSVWVELRFGVWVKLITWPQNVDLLIFRHPN